MRVGRSSNDTTASGEAAWRSSLARWAAPSESRSPCLPRRRTDGGRAWMVRGSMRSVMRCTGAFWSTVRLFVALWPPPEVVDLLAALSRPALPGLRWTTPDQWHVTLRFFGSADPGVAEAALRGTAWPAASRPTAALGNVVARFGRETLYVPVSGVEELAHAVAASTADVGEPPPDRPFTGHLTLARARRGRGDVRPLAGARLAHAARWQVDEVTLVASRLEPGGARYSVVASVPLPPIAEGA